MLWLDHNIVYKRLDLWQEVSYLPVNHPVKLTLNPCRVHVSNQISTLTNQINTLTNQINTLTNQINSLTSENYCKTNK